MSKFIGRQVDIGIAKEAVRGTAETSAAYFLPKLSLSIDDTVDTIIDESSIGVIEDSANSSVIGKHAEGEIEGIIGDKSIGLLLLSLMGGVSTSGPSQTTVYTHTFTVAQDAQHEALTFFLDDTNQDYKYPLGVIDSFDLDVSLGAHAKYTAGFRSKVGETATISPSYTTENNFLPHHASLKIASNTAGLGAASAMDVRSVKLSFKNNLEDDMKLGSLSPTDILNKQFTLEGSVDLVFNDNTFKTDMLADTAKAMRLRLTNSDVVIGTNLNPQITIDIAKFKVLSFERTYSNDDIVMATIEFKGMYSLADTKMVSVELINTATSY